MTALAVPPPAPAIEQPAPRQVSFGLVSGTVARGTRRVVVRVDRRVVADRPLAGRRFSLRVELPARDVELSVTSVGPAGARRTSSVGPVFGLPRAGEPGPRHAPRADAALGRSLRRLADRFGGVSGIYVESLTTGTGAAWNAKARFPAASTLKLAIALAVLRAHDGLPVAGSRVDLMLRRMLVDSDNRSANELEAWLGGSGRVDETIRALGLEDTIMYGGYEVERRLAGPIPIRVERQPSFGPGKHTTAWDLARLLRSVWLAAGARGPFPGALTPPDARYLLFLLAHVRDRGKLDGLLGGRAAVLHKAGWLSTARHDNGLVFWDGGVFVATVMTFGGRGADELAGRVARAAYDRYRAGAHRRSAGRWPGASPSRGSERRVALGRARVLGGHSSSSPGQWNGRSHLVHRGRRAR